MPPPKTGTRDLRSLWLYVYHSSFFNILRCISLSYGLLKSSQLCFNMKEQSICIIIPTSFICRAIVLPLFLIISIVSNCDTVKKTVCICRHSRTSNPLFYDVFYARNWSMYSQWRGFIWLSLNVLAKWPSGLKPFSLTWNPVQAGFNFLFVFPRRDDTQDLILTIC